MGCFKYYIVFCCILCIGCVSLTAGASCNVYNYEGFSFVQSRIDDKPADNLTSWLDDKKNPAEPSLLVNIGGWRESFHLTLFAIPYKKSESECPRSLVGNETLRQYETTCVVSQETDKNKSIQFERIFTGCYYFIMTNDKGNWTEGPLFYNTSYKYRDFELKLIRYPHFKNEEIDANREMETLLKVPLNCIDVSAQLYELDGKKDAEDDIKKMKIHETQKCWFKRNNSEVDSVCPTSGLITNLSIDVTIREKIDDGWLALITWKELRRGGAAYYLRLEPYLTECRKKYGPLNMTRWKLVKRYILLDLGFANGSNVVERTEPTSILYNSIFIITIYTALGVALFAILAYWIKKYSDVWGQKLPERPLSEESRKMVLPISEKKSNNILLLYARGSPPLGKLMVNFRNYLKQACECHVYDLYETDELRMALELGVTEWIGQRLREDNRVVWVDTPEFRSCVNKPREEYSDCYDKAIPFAVSFAVGLITDITTQYDCHFVVRLDGYEVDEKQKDPLEVVSPVTRYHIPEHIDLLCKHLTTPMERLEKVEIVEYDICDEKKVLKLPLNNTYGSNTDLTECIS